MNKASLWANPDGVVVGFGPRGVETNSGAKVVLGGKRQQVVIEIDGSKIPAADVTAQLANGVEIPAGAMIESAKIVVAATGGFAGASSTVDVGLWNATTGVVIADNSLVAAATLANLANGLVVTGAGVAIGAVQTVPTKVGVTWNVAATTAGRATLVVEYIY